MEPASPPDVRWRIVRAALSALVLIVLSVAWIDRPAATWSHNHFHGVASFIGLTRIVDPIPRLALLGLAAAALAAAWGWRPGRWGWTVIACCLATGVSIFVKEELKVVFGRLWPETWVGGNPSWIANGAYGFQPFHGGQGWKSFPSGHTTMITASMAVLWQRMPRLRWLWGSIIVLVMVGLFGANFHFVGDIVAGLYLGVACAAGTLALIGRISEARA